MREIRRKPWICLVAICILFSFGHLQSAYGEGGREEPGRERPEIETIKIAELIEVKTSLRLKSNGVDFGIRAEKAPMKVAAAREEFATVGERRIRVTPILNLDIYGFDLTAPEKRISVHDLKSRIREMPAITVHVKLSSSTHKLFFWEPQRGGEGGRWIPAKEYIGKDIADYKKINRDVTFTIIEWPKDDRAMAGG